MTNRKFPGTDGLTVEFFNSFFFKDIGKLSKSLNEAYDDLTHVSRVLIWFLDV